MKAKFLCGMLAGLVVCASAWGGQYYRQEPRQGGYSRDYYGTRALSYSDYASYGRTYECVPVNEAFISVMHRTVTLKKNTSKYPKTRYAPTGFAVGYAHTVGKLQIGGAFNYEGGNRKMSWSGGGNFTTRNNIPGLSAFATYRPWVDSFYVSGSAYLGFASYKAKSGYFGGLSYGSGTTEHRNVFSLGLEVGKTWILGNGYQVTPHVGLDYTYAPTERYDWRNLPGDWISFKSDSFWEIPLGVSLRKTYVVGGWLLTPKADLSLITSLGKVDPKNAHPGLSYRTADGWKVVGAAGGNFGVRLNLGVDARLNERMRLGLDYTYEGRSKYNDHRISATFGLSF